MTDEVLLIVLAGAWLFVHVCAHGLTQWGVAGNAWAFGARDDPPRETLLSGRLRRAFANYLETLPAALAVLIAAELSGRANELTSYGGWIMVLQPGGLPARLRLRTPLASQYRLGRRDDCHRRDGAGARPGRLVTTAGHPRPTLPR